MAEEGIEHPQGFAAPDDQGFANSSLIKDNPAGSREERRDAEADGHPLDGDDHDRDDDHRSSGRPGGCPDFRRMNG